MISTFVGEVGCYAGAGYCAGYLLALGSEISQCHKAGVIGAINGLAQAIIHPITYLVAKEAALEDYKIHILKACTTALIGAATISHFISAGIIGTTGATVLGLIHGYFVLNSLDSAAAKWGTSSTSIIRSGDYWLSRA